MTNLVLIITYKCNCSCIMCTIHLKNETIEMSIPDIVSILSNKEFSKIEEVNITGGEPTLHSEFENLLINISKVLPALKKIIINTNGIDYIRIDSCALNLQKKISSNIFVVWAVSVDGINKKTNIRGITNSCLLQQKTVKTLKNSLKPYKNAQVVVSFTITSKNYNNIDDIYNFVASNRILLELIIATVNTVYINSQPLQNYFTLKHSETIKLLNNIKKISNKPYIADNYRYLDMVDKKLQGHKYIHPCIFREKQGLLVEPNFDSYLCGMAKESFIGNLMSDEFFCNFFNYDSKKIEPICECCMSNNFSFTNDLQHKKVTLLNYIRRKRIE